MIVGLVFLLPRKGAGGGDLDGRSVVNLSRMTHTWRLFPLAVKVDKRKVASSYVPVFCTETACMLLECSWQSYYNR